MYRRLALFLLSAAAAAPTAASAQHPALCQPFDLQPLPNGHLVVSDLPCNAVYELDAGPPGKGRLVAHVAQARELVPMRDGRHLLVSSGARVVKLDIRTGATTPYAAAKNDLLGIALAPDGWLYGSENVYGSEYTTLVRIRGGVRQVLAPRLHGVHGILVTGRTLVLSEAYGGRILRFHPDTHRIDVLATGLGNPSFALPAPGGGYLVSEFSGNRISHLWPDGHVTTMADVFKPGAIAFDARHRIVGITNDGTVFRIVGGDARTIYS